jgi:hypothetical protein
MGKWVKLREFLLLLFKYLLYFFKLINQILKVFLFFYIYLIRKISLFHVDYSYSTYVMFFVFCDRYRCGFRIFRVKIKVKNRLKLLPK